MKETERLSHTIKAWEHSLPLDLLYKKCWKVLFYQTQKGKSTQNFMVINRLWKLQLHIRIGFKTFYYKIKVKEKNRKR